MPSSIDVVLAHYERNEPGGLLGLALCGSAASGGLRADSDIDLLAVTRRSLTRPERQRLTDLLLAHSGRRATLRPGRPIELTSVVQGELTPWQYPPVCDYRYGEWLRAEYIGGAIPQPEPDPDLAVLLTGARQHATALLGPSPADLLPEVPAEDLQRAVQDCVPGVLADLVGDERNVLLTLARMAVTARTGDIVPKDVAAQQVCPLVSSATAELLERARQGYVCGTPEDWTGTPVGAAADDLASVIRAQ